MNPSLTSVLAVLLGTAGAALAAPAVQSTGFSALTTSRGAAGCGLALSAIVALGISARRSQRDIEEFRNRIDGDGGSDCDLSEPLLTCESIATARIDEMRRTIEAKGAEARRARLTARSMQNEYQALKALLDNLGDGILLLDATRTAVIANASARRFLGLAREAELPKDFSELVKRPTLRPALEKALAGEDRDVLRGRDVDVSDASERLVLRLMLQEIHGPDQPEDSPPQVAVLMRDVTREVEINRMKSDFASSVSHELKTPLCSMRAFLEMILDGDIEGEEAQHEHLRLVLDQTDRLTRLVQNLLNLSRLEAGITKLAREPVAITELLDHLREVVTPLATARRQRIEFHLSEFLPTVTGDSAMLEQAVMNLVSNAIKYTPEEGRVDVHATLAGSNVEIRVIDTGVGIPEKALGTIFEKFTRIENHAGLKATGCGLGLPLAKFVAQAHGGSIKVRSEVGQGSEFRLLLPLRRATDSSEAVLVGLEGMGK